MDKIMKDSEKWRIDNTRELANFVADHEINEVFANPNFGSVSNREVVKQGLLKCAGRFYQGHTSKTILMELGLIGKNYTLTKKGARYLFYAYREDNSL